MRFRRRRMGCRVRYYSSGSLKWDGDGSQTSPGAEFGGVGVSASAVVADLGFGAAFDAPGEPSQAVLTGAAATGVGGGLGEEVTQVRDGRLGEQRGV